MIKIRIPSIIEFALLRMRDDGEGAAFGGARGSTLHAHTACFFSAVKV
jgi:hypothetical protein